ncbi:MAG: hypothetical protein JWP11_2835 [Frankiales bacterium]|nr:hypothetical protein [Frankiales bacterium]
MTFHSCTRTNSSCARCRACDALRAARRLDTDAGPFVARVCAHCDGEAAHALATRRTR